MRDGVPPGPRSSELEPADAGLHAGQPRMTPSAVPDSAHHGAQFLEQTGSAATKLRDSGSQKTDAELDRFQDFLSSGHYEEAIEHYRLLYNQVSEAESEPYRAKILRQANNLAADSDHMAVIELLERYTSVFYKDLPALRKLANSQHVLRRYDDEITTLIKALNEATLQADIIRFRRQLDTSAMAEAAILTGNHDVNGVVALFEKLIARDPDHSPMHIAFARALVQLDQPEQAYEVLQSLPADSGPAATLLATIERARASGATDIPIYPRGESYIVDAVINGRTRIKLLIDTGASMTIIRPSALRLAGIDLHQFQRSVIFNTANGRVRAPVLQLNSLALGQQVVHDIDVGSLRLEALDGVDGLLGMNYLNSFKFTLNQQEQVILLTR